ncbi:MAG TPA: enoyl-CoA hydratase/isomerase family protein [Blastocatellia bacterium]|nr:enoyl-CoA hydratase/isomerase family protein [Blastocatellia bacterium]
MATHYKDIQFSVTDRVARIAFSRPPLNILTIAMMKEIVDAINRASQTQDCCAIVFSSSQHNGAFSAGVSIEEHRSETVFQMLEGFHSIFRTLNTISKPVIAVVGGAALGGGCELAAFADIVIASTAARFGQPEIKVGIFPPAAAVILPRVIGTKRAREMVLTGELLTAETAQSLGLVNHVVPESALASKCEELLNSFRQMSVPGLEMARRAMVQTWGLGFNEALKRSEDIYLNELMSFRDPQEGIEAFIAKRPPRWKHK